MSPIRIPAGVIDGRPAALSASTVELLLLGWAKAPPAPQGEPGRWQMGCWSEEEIRQVYRAHRTWLFEEARRRGLRRPWAEATTARRRGDDA